MDSDSSRPSLEKHRAWGYEGEYFGEISPYLGIGPWTPSSTEEDVIEEGALTPIVAVATACILQDALDELTILKYVIGAPEVYWNLNYKSLKERYTRRLTPQRIFPEVDTRPVLTSAIKLQRDRDSIEAVFQKLAQTLAEQGEYTPLISALNSLRYEEEDDILLIKELRSNLIQMRDLVVKVEEKKKLDEQEERERDELRYQLQDELDDVRLKCDVEEKFVDKWENVRSAQNDWRLKMAEDFLRNSIADLNTKSRLEKRVTNELQNYLKIQQLELEEELEAWMAKYDSEMERRENKILHLKYDRDQAEEKKHQLHKLYEARSLEMKEWVEFRENRKIRIGASLVIQSWWRGMMVRKKLGPYKPKKHKEKGGKKKK